MFPQNWRRVPNQGNLRGFLFVFIISLHIAPLAQAGAARFSLAPLGATDGVRDRSGAQLVGDGDALFVVHAHADSAKGAPVEMYDRDSDTFTLLPGRFTPRTEAAVVRVGDTLVLLGGETATGATDIVETMNIVTGEVSVATSMPAPRTGAHAVVRDGLLMVIGGGSGWGATNEALFLDLRTQRWHRVSVDSADHISAVLDGRQALYAALHEADGTAFAKLDTKTRAFGTQARVAFACDRLIAPLKSGLLCVGAEGQSALFRPGKGVKAGPRLHLPQGQSAVAFDDGLALLDSAGNVLAWSRTR